MIGRLGSEVSYGLDTQVLAYQPSIIVMIFAGSAMPLYAFALFLPSIINEVSVLLSVGCVFDDLWTTHPIAG